MEMCLDEKWKLSSSSKKGSRRSAAVAPATSEASPRGRTSSTGPAARSVVPGRLASLVKEQGARFYIMRRCVTMLVCWRD
ncbi:small polypeptide DEVIL 11-like [Miscanthus floridulus]|uniref:small polypeptide DEVIL 11-like n=1 Tax=Miscanthus floridulus TaxID=154761 RepID=UPI00345A2BDC